jgi:hypothetical protein
MVRESSFVQLPSLILVGNATLVVATMPTCNLHSPKKCVTLVCNIFGPGSTMGLKLGATALQGMVKILWFRTFTHLTSHTTVGRETLLLQTSYTTVDKEAC